LKSNILNNNIFYIRLASILTQKWRANGRLPHNPIEKNIHNGRGYSPFEYNMIGCMYHDAKRTSFSSFYYANDWDGSHSIGDSYGYFIGPIISFKEVLADMWPELNEAERTNIMSSVLGKNEIF